MQNKPTIMEINNLNNYQLDEPLGDAMKEFNWRIHSNNYKELFAEVSENLIKGIGFSWTNHNHPNAKYIHVIASTSANEIMKKLLIHITPHDKVIFSCWEDEREKIQLVQQFQFQLFRKTYMEQYNIEDLLLNFKVKDTVPTLLPLQQILNQSILDQDLFQLLKYSYEQTHLHNPVREMNWQTWKEDLLNDTPDLQLSYVAIEDDQVIAYIFLHAVNDTHYEVGWVGQRRNFNLHTFLKQQLIQLAHIGVKTVEFEVDTTDFNAWQFAELLKLDRVKSWNTYILERK